MVNTPMTKEWKEVLLKSSLPLEHVIAEKLSKLGMHVSGEYHFLRPNEDQVVTDFSSDFWAFQFLEETEGKENFWACLNFLIECKYSHPGVKWIFSPLPNTDQCVIGFINVFQDLSVKRIKTDALYEFDREIPYCIKGVELYERGFNPASIARGLHQLRYAAVSLSEQCIAQQAASRHDEESEIRFLCPILVTTSRIYVLKGNLSMDAFRRAENIDGIAEEAEAVIVNQGGDMLLSRYVESMNDELCRTYSDLDRKVKDLAEILKDSDYGGYYMSSAFFLKDKLREVPQRVLVVNYDAFDKTVARIFHIVNNTKSTLTHIGHLVFDKETGITSIRRI